MVLSTNCCLNLSPPHGPPSLPTKTTKIGNRQKKREMAWRNKSVVLSLSCVLIGLQIGDIVLAEEMQANSIAFELINEKAVKRWSDKRSCASWRLNSLETIVPENLPRPAAHRRWETVGFDTVNAPVVKDIGVVRFSTSNSGCFSM